MHTFKATAAAGEIFTVREPEPLAAIAELMADLDFGDLEERDGRRRPSWGIGTWFRGIFRPLCGP